MSEAGEIEDKAPIVDIERVLWRMFYMGRDNAWRLLFVAAALIGIPALLGPLVVGHAPGGWSLVIVVAGSVLGVLAMAAVTLVGLERSQGRRSSLGGVLGETVAALPQLVAISFIQTLAIPFGLMLLIAPGFYILAGFSVAAPLQLMRNEGIIKSLQQSVRLTQGSMLRILGVMAIVGIPAVAVFCAGWMLAGLAPERDILRTFVVYPLVQALWTVAAGLMAASIFHELWWPAAAGPEIGVEVFD
jgi:hypothetical protein